MKRLLSIFVGVLLLAVFSIGANSCGQTNPDRTANKEQSMTEENQRGLLEVQPPPKLTWSLERDNLIKRFKLMNDRSIMFYMYVFVPGVADPIGYYQVNKVSSVNSQLTNTEQVVDESPTRSFRFDSPVTLPSPAEDGSYGTNGDGVFGFTPEDIYLEHNMLYMVSTVPLNFRNAVIKLTVINVETQKQLKELMDKIK